ncbi:MAG: glycosyltransferase family 39 protein [Anaerolineae bacterium]
MPAVSLTPGKAAQTRWALTALLAVYLLLAGAYSIINPLFEAPDEVWHYALMQHLAQGQTLPVLDPKQPGPWAQEGGQPPLYYWLAAQALRWLPASDWQTLLVANRHADIGSYSPDSNSDAFIHTPAEAWPYRGAALAIHLARLFSVLLGAGTLYCVYRLGRLVWPSRPWLALAGAALLALNPMFLFISASVSNDNLVTLLAALTLLLILQLIQRPPVFWCWLVLGGVIGLAALSKISALALLAPAGLALTWMSWRRHDWRVFVVGGLCLVVSVGAVAGWWYWRNLQLYGDPLGLNVFVATIGPRVPQVSLLELTAEWQGLVRSFWGVFGWMNVVAPDWFYYLLDAVTLLGLAGLIYQLVKRLVKHSWPAAGQAFQAALLVIWPLVVFISLVRWTMITPATQGRLLFPAAGCLMLLLAYGLGSLLPDRWRALPQGTALVLLGGLAVWVPYAVIRPAYQPVRPLSSAEQAAIPNRVNISYEQRIALVGYQVNKPTAEPDGWLSVTLYWQAERQEESTLSVFVQLVDIAGGVLANRNMLLGGGSHTTPYWVPGEVISQTYRLRVSPFALNPSSAELIVGLYQLYQDNRRLKAYKAGDIALGDAYTIENIGIAADPQGEIYNSVHLELENGITLVGYNLERNTFSPGDTVHVTLFWKARAPVYHDYATFVQALDPAGSARGQLHKHLDASEPGTSTWQVGQISREDYNFTLAADSPAGMYALDIGMYLPETAANVRVLNQDGSPGDNHIILAHLKVNAP